MPYPAGHRLEVRKNIIESARKLFNRYGFDNVSISQIMEGAGLTHGGFYSYFESKSDLYSDILGCFLTDPEWKNCWQGVHVDLSSTDVGPQVVRAYLSRQHFDDIEHSCPMVALPSDVARSGEGAKRAFETVFKAMVSTLERSLLEKNLLYYSNLKRRCYDFVATRAAIVTTQSEDETKFYCTWGTFRLSNGLLSRWVVLRALISSSGISFVTRSE
jgi:AcrR family transcriptional regulator